MNPLAAASLPPSGLAGLDPSWSRLVRATDRRGVTRTWHLLDAGPRDGGPPAGTLLCVHGNPTWSYTWRSVVAAGSAAGWRVVAPDHLGMGFSERTGHEHRLADRVAELGAVTEALDLSGPVVTVAHDWGGVISLAWALDHRAVLAGIVLANTAVSQPPDARVPALIALARTPGLLGATTVTTPTFLTGTLHLAHPPLTPAVRAAYLAPYRTAARRSAIGGFVADIPLGAQHPSRPTLDAVGARLPELADVPTLLVWGPRDPVFSDRYLRDLQQRLPHAHTHRFEGAGHLVVEDAPVADAVVGFVADLGQGPADPAAPAEPSRPAPAPEPVPTAPPREAPERRHLGHALAARAADPAAALVELGPDGPRRTVSWAQLSRVVDDLAAGLVAVGVRPGDRLALLVPPGADLTAAAYACWRARAVVVLADAGLGLPGLRRALRGADLTGVVGTAKGLVAAGAMGLPGRRVLAGAGGSALRRSLGASHTLTDLARTGRGTAALPPPAPGDEAAVLFTSGATGPAKGVVYRHAQLEAQRDVLREGLGLRASDRFVAAFAPFALYGPALGVTTAVPDMDVTSPATLTAGSLADAVAAIDASVVFGAPAALRNVVATADDLEPEQRDSLARVRMLLSAGAPVPTETLRAAAALMGGCEAHTPYGMTEALPIADITLSDLEQVGTGTGVCVGMPFPGVRIAVSGLTHAGRAEGALTTDPGVTGEICVRAPHVKDGYDQLWSTERSSSRDTGWHRTGDVGHLDTQGRLWVEGRLGHVAVTAEGPVTPVGPERRVEQLDSVRLAALVGVGPRGTQALVMVVESPGTPPGPADLELTEAVREHAGLPIAAVLVVPDLPVDIRHNSKIDRAAVAAHAEQVLSGQRSS
ncbi:MAG: alpha/beta fold hydrolase [Actinomycetota bacterium]|nr:alpha/beta fold hydrolase [Actinomycetota bacterium]